MIFSCVLSVLFVYIVNFTIYKIGLKKIIFTMC